MTKPLLRKVVQIKSFFLSFLFILATHTFAALPDCDEPGVNPLKYPHCTFQVVGQLVVVLINGLMIVGALFGLFNLFKSGFLYLTAGDNREQLEEARKNITWSVIGMFGLAIVFTLFQFLISTVPNLEGMLF